MSDAATSKALAARLRKEAQAGWHGDFAAFLTECANALDGTAHELCPDCEKLRQLLATTLDGETGIHVSTGGKGRDEKLFSAHDIQAFTAMGFALRKKHEAERAAQARAIPRDNYGRLQPPHGYAYRYHSVTGGTVVSFDRMPGREPIEVIPYWLGAPVPELPTPTRLTDAQCDEIIVALETYDWKGFSRDEIRLIAGTIEAYRGPRNA